MPNIEPDILSPNPTSTTKEPTENNRRLCQELRIKKNVVGNAEEQAKSGRLNRPGNRCIQSGSTQCR